MRPNATYVPDLDPGPMHDYANVVRQIHGGTNAGFVADYLTITDAARAGHVMTGFAPDKVPVLATLAKEFAVCDNWFSSLPGPTWPNRFFVHCATAGGYVDGAPRNYPMRTLYENLSDAHVNWRIYYHDIPQSLALQNQRKFFHAQVRDLQPVLRARLQARAGCRSTASSSRAISTKARRAPTTSTRSTASSAASC